MAFHCTHREVLSTVSFLADAWNQADGSQSWLVNGQPTGKKVQGRSQRAAEPGRSRMQEPRRCQPQTATALTAGCRFCLGSGRCVDSTLRPALSLAMPAALES